MALKRSELRRYLEPVGRRIRLLIRRAVIAAVDDSRSLQLVKVRGISGEVADGVERFQDYGFTSVPRAGAPAVVAALLGAADHLVALKVDDPANRLNGLADGEVALYSRFGAKIVLRADGSILIDSPDDVDVVAGGNVSVQAAGDAEVVAGGDGKLEATGSAELTGATVTISATGAVSITGSQVSLSGDVQIDGKDFIDHVHSGVQAGPSNTGPVV